MKRIYVVMLALLCAIAGLQSDRLLSMNGAALEDGPMAAVCPCESPVTRAAEQPRVCAACRADQGDRETGSGGGNDPGEMAVFALGILALGLLRRRGGRAAPRPIESDPMAMDLDTPQGLPGETACDMRSV